jgi:hypothetical protein
LNRGDGVIAQVPEIKGQIIFISGEGRTSATKYQEPAKIASSQGGIATNDRNSQSGKQLGQALDTMERWVHLR